jgi:predicted dithiol-disulfide oxidoreductase (DUF899 family)
MNDRIRELEMQIYALKQDLGTARAEAEPEAVNDYEFQTIDGAKKLSEMFGGMDDLFIVHNMGRSCQYCSLWADGLDGYFPHIAGRAALVLISPDAPEVQREFADKRGWRFPTATDRDKKFTDEMGYIRDEGFYPGISAFHKGEDGKITRTGTAVFGPGDDFCPVWPLFELRDGGAKGWEPPE